ncbi:MAG: helix-turn-helix transcriptional regulator [Alphaproteobacteria bacterium]
MSQSGHTLLRAPELAEIDRRALPLAGLASDYPAGHHIPPHAHATAQLIHASSGMMTVRAAGGSWVVPPQGAVWMPPGTQHEIHCHGKLAMRSLYFASDTVSGLPGQMRVLAVTGLLRELIGRIATEPFRPLDEREIALLLPVVLDEIGRQPTAPLHLPMADEPRLARVMAGVLADPGAETTLAGWARQAGVSARTLARLFESHTGQGFRAWRRQARLLQALAWLSEGRAVTTVALDLGYDSPSAFIAMFRRALGTTPGRLLANDGS